MQIKPPPVRCVKIYGERHATHIKVMTDKSLRFSYMVGPDMGFCFSLFCEVGEPYKQGFRDLLREHGLKLAEKYLEFDYKPWIADTLKVPHPFAELAKLKEKA